MGGYNDDIDDLDEEFDLDGEDGDEGSFDDEDFDGEGNSGKKKSKSESGFDRNSYYVYKDKLVQLSGTIRPKERNAEGQVVALDFKTDDKIYSIVMDDMGKKLVKSCYQEYLVTGLVSKISEKEYTLAIKTYI